MKVDKKAKLIEAAKKLFVSEGYYNTSLADISVVSKVPLGNVHYYFKTKRELLLAVIDDMELCPKSFQNLEPNMVRKLHMLRFYADGHKELSA